MKKITSFLLVVCMVFSLSACGGNKYSKFQWPNSSIAKLISQPKSNIGEVIYDSDSSFWIDVAKTSKSDYGKYVDDCWNKGFTVDYYRSDTSFWASNEDGYHLTLMYKKNVMSIMMDWRNTSEETEDEITDEPVVELGNQTPAPEPDEPSPEPEENLNKDGEEIKDSTDVPAEPSESTPPETSLSDRELSNEEIDFGLTGEQMGIIQDIINGINSTDEEKPKALYYSTNTLEEAKKGNSGVFSYKRSLSNYDIYWIINFNNGYAYWFTYGNGNTTCERVRIDEGDGDLNSYITVTYHDGNDSWQYGLCFKRARQPDRLIQSEEDGTQYEFIATDLYDALDIVYELEIVDY